MRQPTVTLEAIAPSTTLLLADAYNVLLGEDGEPLLDETGVPLYGEDGEPLLAEDGEPLLTESVPLVAETFAVSVTLATIAPTVVLVLRRNA